MLAIARTKLSWPNNRWWIYQRERFPLLAHGLLIAAFSFSGVSFSNLLRQTEPWPSFRSILVAFATSFLFFLQLRIADEFKDFAEDARFRPYRPVPRGLVELRELRLVAVSSAFAQLALAFLLSTNLALVLFAVWIYLALMSKEFFVRDWIKARPITYLWTHMLILPLVDFYATACDWAATARPPRGLLWFLVISFFNGVVLEIGRKLRAPSDEETGVQTYTFLWGLRMATFAWFSALILTVFCAWQAVRKIDWVLPTLAILGILLAVASALVWQFVQNPTTTRAKRIEQFSGLWTVLMYLTIGAFPLIGRYWNR